MKVHLIPPILLSSIQLWPIMVYSRRDNNRRSRNNRGGGGGDTRIFHTRIIGGRSAQPDSFPYVVSIQNTISGHYCGGSLIGRDVVLTAAHCGEVPFDQVSIGQQDLSTNEGQEIPISSAIIHPNFNDDTNLNNDVMLIFLENPITPNSSHSNVNVQLVKLNSDESCPPSNSPVTVAGWGRTEANVAWSFSNQLMTVDVNVISNGECEISEGTYGGAYANYVGQITEGMLCAKGENKDTCNGDSGGPLVYDNSADGLGSTEEDVVQVGLVSGGIGCALPDFPGVYTRISHYYEWIREEVCERSLYPPADFECGGGGDGEEEEIEARIEFHESSSVRDHDGYSNDIDVYGSNDLPLNEHLFPHHSAPPCADTDGWKDSFEDGCGWYEINDKRGCPEYGNDYEGESGLANDNCCHCMLEDIR
mmetsp:Transcript_5987/g.11530  ORF Transcript_5987/g.11530 Transcript_5987/m.11530 type:complete len:420 (-) Transcript_5987:287-1546(-)